MNDPDAMPLGREALEATDWSGLEHAYGSAEDTPELLLALFEGDPEAHEDTLAHLWYAVIHQGTPWTVTGPAALVVAGLFLGDERPDLDDEVRANLVSFLVSVAEAGESSDLDRAALERLAASHNVPAPDAADWDDDTSNPFYARSILGCLRVAPVLMRVMRERLTDADPRVRAHAAMGAAILARVESLRGHAGEVESELRERAGAAWDGDERAAFVMALGDLGASTRDFLEDHAPGVRICAALAPGLASDPAALGILLDALEHHAGEIDGWFTDRPPQFVSRPRFSVVKRLIERVEGFDRLADAAVAVAEITEKYCVDSDWGPLLVAAFPDGDGVLRTQAQRRYLAALVKNAGLWDPRFGNPSLWFMRAGLNYDRKACAKLVKRA